jgi:hypothetical protein
MPSPTPFVPPGKNKPPTDAGKDHGAMAGNGFVECDLKRPSSKIIFSDTLSVGSNAKATRVCMSENACLNLINAYASARNCTMAAGAASSEAKGQCTAIFPGSRGTCKKAQTLSDAQVGELLEKMGSFKQP